MNRSERKAAEIHTRPCPIKQAVKFNLGIHRRLPKCLGGMWALAAVHEGGLVIGVAIVGHPQARLSCNGYRLEVLRVATDGTANACSCLYGATSRAARAMGASDLFTFVHEDESGHSLKAAGWTCIGPAGGGEWGTPNRPRQLVIDAKPKIKWAVPWGELARDKTRREKP